MDDKLLHERMREWADVSKDACRYPIDVTRREYGLRARMVDERELFRIFADEIEREYIPREKHDEEVSAIISAQKDSPHHIMALYAERNGKPVEHMEQHDVPFDMRNGAAWQVRTGRRDPLRRHRHARRLGGLQGRDHRARPGGGPGDTVQAVEGVVERLQRLSDI